MMMVPPPPNPEDAQDMNPPPRWSVDAFGIARPCYSDKDYKKAMTWNLVSGLILIACTLGVGASLIFFAASLPEILDAMAVSH